MSLTKDILTPKDLMEYFQIGKNVAYELLITGEIKSFKVRSQYRIKKDDLLGFIEQQSDWRGQREER